MTKAMNASKQFDEPKGPQRDDSCDPSSVSFERATSRIDIVDMLMERRRFQADRLVDNVESVHLYSDSSPVTHSELQGMIADVVRFQGEPRRIVLPGASLCLWQL